MPLRDGPWTVPAWAAGVLLGTALQLQLAQPWGTSGRWVLAVGAALLVLGVRRRWPVATWLLCAACAAGALTDWRAELRLADRLAPALEGLDCRVTGRVLGLPQPSPDGLRFDLAPDAPAHCVDGQSPRLPSRVALSWPRHGSEDVLTGGPPPALGAGERWELLLRLRRPHGLLNPDGFDAELWLFEQGVGAQGTVRPGANQRLDGPRWSHPNEVLAAWRHQLRDRVLLLAGPSAGVLAALALGDQAALSEAQWDEFRLTGVAHLMSISGLHITGLAWLGAVLVAGLWRRQPRALHRCAAAVAGRWGGLCVAGAYALLAGWGVPAQRTVWMLATSVVLRHAGVQWPAWRVLLVAATGVVLWDPWALLQAGFWLSFVAVGLLVAAEPQGLAQRPAAAGWALWASRLRAGLKAQLVASLGLAPLSLLLFQQLSWVGFVANVVAVPVVTFCITPLALIGLALPPAWAVATWVLEPLLHGLHALAGLPLAVWQMAAPTLPATLVAMLGAVLWVVPLPWRVRCLALPLFGPLLSHSPDRPPPGHFELLVADVGQGSAVLVRTAGHVLLHDAGPRFGPHSDAGRRVLWPLLLARGEWVVDELLLSHRDSDHVGGASVLLERLTVGRLRLSLEAQHPLRRSGPPVIDCTAGQRWTWDGVDFEVLHPPAGLPDTTRPNARSCVLKVSDSAGRAALLTGDIEAEQERALVQHKGQALRADVLLVPHHGSRSSSSAEFLAAVQPQWAVAQLGYRNRFGHPDATVVHRYQAAGINLVRTDQCGAWHWQAPAAWCERDSRRRYWHDRPVTE